MQVLIEHEYQGNGTWAAFGVIATLLAAYPWLRLRSMRKLGQSIELRKVIALSMIFLAFSVVALIQVLTHQ